MPAPPGFTWVQKTTKFPIPTYLRPLNAHNAIPGRGFDTKKCEDITHEGLGFGIIGSQPNGGRSTSNESQSTRKVTRHENSEGRGACNQTPHSKRTICVSLGRGGGIGASAPSVVPPAGRAHRLQVALGPVVDGRLLRQPRVLRPRHLQDVRVQLRRG